MSLAPSPGSLLIQLKPISRKKGFDAQRMHSMFFKLSDFRRGNVKTWVGTKVYLRRVDVVRGKVLIQSAIVKCKAVTGVDMG